MADDKVKTRKFRVKEGGMVGGKMFQPGDEVELPESMMAHAGEDGPLEAVDGSKPAPPPTNGGIPTKPEERRGAAVEPADRTAVPSSDEHKTGRHR